MNIQKVPHVVIIGAGFGGLMSAQKLAGAPVQITVIDRHNYHLFQPLLYQVAIAGLVPSQIAYPLRTIFRRHKNVDFLMSEVSSIDFESRYVKANGSVIAYDYLILSVGGQTNFFGMLRVSQAFAPALKENGGGALLNVLSVASWVNGGLLAGFVGNRIATPIVGIGVSRDPADQEPLVHAEAQAVADLLGLDLVIPRAVVKTIDGYWQPKYSLPNPMMVEAVQWLARCEALLLDPVYTGKAMAGLIGLAREGFFGSGERVLFVHTGGLPSLFAYHDVVLGDLPGAG